MWLAAFCFEGFNKSLSPHPPPWKTKALKFSAQWLSNHSPFLIPSPVPLHLRAPRVVRLSGQQICLFANRSNLEIVLSAVAVATASAKLKKSCLPKGILVDCVHLPSILTKILRLIDLIFFSKLLNASFSLLGTLKIISWFFCYMINMCCVCFFLFCVCVGMYRCHFPTYLEGKTQKAKPSNFCCARMCRKTVCFFFLHMPC